MNDYRDEFMQIQNRPDQWKLTVRHRKLRMVKTGTWFFGLLNTYALVYTDWEESHD